jgi:hypothetical protein
VEREGQSVKVFGRDDLMRRCGCVVAANELANDDVIEDKVPSPNRRSPGAQLNR